MGKTQRSKRQNKTVAMFNQSKAGAYRPTRKFHINKAIPTKRFKEELDVKEKSQD